MQVFVNVVVSVQYQVGSEAQDVRLALIDARSQQGMHSPDKSYRCRWRGITYIAPSTS